MKRILKSSSKLLASCLILAVSILAWSPQAEAQVTPIITGLFTGVPTTVATNGVASTNSSAILVPHGKALAILPEFALHSAGTGNVVFTAQVTADGTNYTTASGLTYTIAATGTTTARGLWLLDPTELAGVQSIRLSAYSNAANAVVLTNILVRYSYAAP
jgi:hypothetical protein